MSKIRVAVTQHEPVWLDLDAGVEKTIKIIEEAAKADAKLVAFPECWIPGYPGMSDPSLAQFPSCTGF